MFSSSTIALVLGSLLASQALPIRREVPQEHSHEATIRAVAKLLALNNPDKIVDPVFGLLGNAAASNGKGNIADPDCLQQATADQAFTNAKAAGNVQGQTDALIYRALERNTGKVGLASVKCTSIQAKNPEIAAIQQHQDPASTNAAAINKAIVLELAKQIAKVGGDPLQALNSGTFAPGDVNDNTGKGNTCDDPNDAVGCIFSQKLIVSDASEAEIEAAVGGATGGNTGAGNNGNGNNNAGNGNAAGGNNAGACPAPVTVTVQPAATAVATKTAAQATPTAGNASNAAGGNLQKFTGALGGKAAPAVRVGGKGFIVEGSDEFLNIGAALGRSCDIQHNACANFANSATGRSAGLSVGACDQQNNECHAAI